MLDKCEEGTRYIHRNQFETAIVPNAFGVASARRDERELCECRPGDETNCRPTLEKQSFRFYLFILVLSVDVQQLCYTILGCSMNV